MAITDLLGGLLGGSAGKSDMKEARELSRDAAAKLDRLYVPTTAEQEVDLITPELAGLLAAEQMQGTSLDGVSSDPRLKNAQMRALEELSGLSQTGLGPEDKAALNQILRSSGAQAQAQNAAVLQDAAQRGTLDSGNVFAAQLMAGQQAANRSSEQGMQQAAQAAAARRAALGQYADMSSSMSNQDFSQKAQIANAKDAIAQFNTQNRQNVNQLNLGQQQNIENQRAATSNQQQLYNKGLVQQQFQNNLAKASGAAQQTQNLAGMYANQGQAAAQGQANMMGGLLGTGAQLGAAYLSRPASTAGTAQQPTFATTDDLYAGPKRNPYDRQS